MSVTREELVEKVALDLAVVKWGVEQVDEAKGEALKYYIPLARAAIDVVLEEAARVAVEDTPLPAWVDEADVYEYAAAAYDFSEAIAAAIRALKSGDR